MKFDEGSVRLILCLLMILFFWMLMKVFHKCTTLLNVVLVYIFVGFAFALIFYSLSQSQWYAFDQSEVTFKPLLFLIASFFIMVIPFSFLDIKKIKYIDDRQIIPYLNKIAICLGLLSVFPFINGLIKLSSLNFSAIREAYEGNNASNSNFIVFYSNQFRNYLNFFVSPLFFYYMYKGEKYKLYFYFVTFALFTTLLLSLVYGGRGIMVNEINYLIVCYFIFKRVLSKESQKKVRKVGLIVSVVVIISLTIITFARSNFSINHANKTQKLDLIVWVSLYLGQGPLEFSRQMYDSKVRTEGDNSFSLIKYIMGEKTFKDNNARRDYWKKKQNIQNYIFYTVIGDVYSDLGAFQTIFFLIIVSTVLAIWFRRQSKSGFTIQTVIIVSIYFEWVTMGTMTNCFKAYYSQFFILITLIIILVLSMIQRNKQNISIK